jgi:hypothetical protein
MSTSTAAVQSLSFPTNIAELAGIPDLNETVVINDANSIKNNYVAKNTTASQTMALLEFLVENVYGSTPNKEVSPYACEFNGLAKLACKTGATRNPRPDGEPIRSVTLAGAFVPALWATGGTPLELSEVGDWYTLAAFKEMKKIGLNTAKIPVPTAAYTPKDKYGEHVMEVLTVLLTDIDTAGLQVIIELVGTGDELDAVVAAAEAAADMPVVLGLTLPKGMTLDTTVVVEAIRSKSPDLPIFLPLNEGDLIKVSGQFDPYVYGALDLPHTVAIADIASSSSIEDRSKMFYHEAVACMTRSPIEYAECFQQMPIFLSSGFDLSIDDCVMQGISETFKDYGQCDRFDETIDSGWWARHRASFASRQLFAAERGLGWSFSAWKVSNTDMAGVLDTPAKLMSLQDVVAAGLFPHLPAKKGAVAARAACLNPPENDFAMGDATYAPTAGPPPDCGNGWWNYETLQCDYWIPPPPPTMSPTDPCPECEVCPDLTVVASSSQGPATSTTALALAAAGGAAGVVLLAAIYKLFTKSKKSEYTEIPH